MDPRTHVRVERWYFGLRTEGLGWTGGQPEDNAPAPKGGGITQWWNCVMKVYRKCCMLQLGLVLNVTLLEFTRHNLWFDFTWKLNPYSQSTRLISVIVSFLSCLRDDWHLAPMFQHHAYTFTWIIMWASREYRLSFQNTSRLYTLEKFITWLKNYIFRRQKIISSQWRWCLKFLSL